MRLGVAAARQPVDGRAARVAQAQEPGHLVVGFAGGVVDRGAEQLDVVGDAADPQDLGVAAGDQQRAQILRQRDGRPATLRQRRRLEQPDADVRHQVVDRVQRLAGGDGERLGRAHPHHQRAGQPGPGGDGDGVHVLQRHAGVGQRLPQGGDEGVEVGAGGDLRDHPAEADVLLHRGGHGVGQQGGAADDADAGLVAGGFDAQHQRLGAVHRVCSVVSGCSAGVASALRRLGRRGRPAQSLSCSRMIRASTPSR